MRTKGLLLLLLVLLLGFGVRLYRFTNPVADWHSWRQADTSAVSRNFVDNGFDILHPKFYDISNVPSGKDNPQGYRFVEFPIYNIAQAGLYKFIPVLSIEEWGRVVSIVASLFGSLFLFLIVKRRASSHAAWLVLLFSLFIPYNIYYSRTILPDTSMVATFLGGIFFLDKWLDGWRKKGVKPQLIFLLISMVFTTASLLLKPYTIFYAITFITLLFTVLQWRMFKRWELWMYLIVSIVPLALWRKYIAMYPEGIPANTWLFNGNGIRFRPAFFRWIFYERLTKLISGYVGVIFVVLGAVHLWLKEKERYFFLSFGVSALTYVCVIATGNVQHDYYQIVVMPAVAIFMGFGAEGLILLFKKYVPRNIAYGIVGIGMLLSFFFAWQQVKDYFNINNPSLIVAGEAVDNMTPKNAKVIAPYDGDTTLLYYTHRKGWPSFEKSLEDLIGMGADYLVLVNPKPQDLGISEKYKLVSSSSAYLLFNLHQKP